MKRTITISLIFLLLLTSGLSLKASRHTHRRDSLFKELTKTNDNHRKGTIYITLTKLYFDTVRSEAIPFLDKAIALGEKYNYKDVLVKGYFLKSKSFRELQPDSFLYFSNKSIQLQKDVKDSMTMVLTYRLISDYYTSFDDKQKVIDYLQKALLFTKGLAARKETGGTYIELAYAQLISNQYDSARKYCNLCLALPATHSTLSDKGYAYYILGRLTHGAGEFSKALTHYKKADSLFRAINDVSGKINVMEGMDEVYYSLEDYEQCLTILNEVRRIVKENGEKAMLKEPYICMLLGDTYNKMKRFDEAEKVLAEGIKLAEKFHAPAYKEFCEAEIANTYIGQEKYALALPLIEPLFKKELNLKLYRSAIMYAARIMKCNHGLGRYKENLTLIESLLPFNKKKEYAFLFMPLYTAAKKTALALNNYKEAYRFQELEHALVDSVNTRKNEDNAAALREEYKTKIQADQIELLKREKQINELTDHKKTITIYSLIGGIALILLLALLIVRQLHLKRKIAEEKRKTEEQKALQFRLKALSAQMNPHFIFNALNSIQHFISNNDIKSSKEYLAKFAKLMRKTLDNSTHDTIPLDQELEALTEYMELEKIRTSNQFNYKINIDPNLQSEQVEVPPLLFQPYVENAIWHGISNKINSDGLITITLSQKEGKLGCTIEDNGIGVKKSQENAGGKHKSLGTSITQTRVDLLNSMEENQIAVKITDKSELNATEQGTKIELTLPLG